jgi:ABC-type nitrate/sulfonate/bicarbonate transport system permease component
MCGIGNATPILLITLLVLPTLAVNTLNGLQKRNEKLEEYLISIRSRKSAIFSNVYLPILVPVLQSNLSLGMGLAAKVVVLGEFIGAQDGLGYLLNNARIFINMKEVFFYLLILLVFSLLFQAVQSILFSLFFSKYTYAE